MSFVEVALTAGALAAGVAAGSLGVFYFYKARENSTKSLDAPKKNFEEIENVAIQRLVPKPELERTKRELRTLLLEKDMVSAALTRLYEAEASHEITREEREILGLKYREELKALDEKILKVDSFIEVGDLETLREQLVDLVRNKVEAIERRIERAKLSSSPLLAQVTKPGSSQKLETRVQEPVSKVPNISDLVEMKPQNTPIKEPERKRKDEIEETTRPVKKKTGDEQVDNLQKELLEALDRLEKLDIEN